MATRSHFPKVAAASRVYLTAPSAAQGREFLSLVRQSRNLHGRWVTPPATAAAFRAYLERSAREDACSRWVRSREDDSLVGVYNLSQIFYGGFQSAYLGYYAFAPAAGQGLMSAGLHLLLAEIFAPRSRARADRCALGLHRIEANIQPENHASIALVQGCGFTQEGFSRRYLKIAGRFRDHARFALLREDWQAQRGAARSR